MVSRSDDSWKTTPTSGSLIESLWCYSSQECKHERTQFGESKHDKTSLTNIIPFSSGHSSGKDSSTVTASPNISMVTRRLGLLLATARHTTRRHRECGQRWLCGSCSCLGTGSGLERWRSPSKESCMASTWRLSGSCHTITFASSHRHTEDSTSGRR